MGYKVLRTESAERDLDEIISYLVEKLCNPPAAVELLSAIDATYTRLEETPFLYVLCQHKLLSRRGYRKVFIRGYPHRFDGSSWNGASSWLRIPVGLYDAPETQSQGIQYIDFHESGHLGIYGSPSSGKTTMLKTILLSAGLNFTPEEVQIYGIDCGGWSTGIFASMPHVGGIALDCEQEKVEKLAAMIEKELDRRKKLFVKNRVGSLDAYRASVARDVPAWVIFADNLPALF